MLRHEKGRRKAAKLARLLVALGLAIAAVPSQLSAESGAYRVTLSPIVILPSEASGQPGVERSVRLGEVVLRAPLGWLSTAVLAQPVEVEIAGARERFERGALLLQAFEARGGDLEGLSLNARVYCGEERQSSTLVAAPAEGQRRSNPGSRLRRNSRFCLVDSDKDDQFDRAFLVGTREDQDRRMTAIAPTPFEAVLNRPIGEGDYVLLTYGEGGLLRHPQLQLDLFRGGEREGFQIMLTRAGSTIIQTRARSRIDGDQVPRQFWLGSARLSVTEFDEATKQASFRLDRDFVPLPVMFTAAPQTTYIYVPGVR